ncbi:MAG: serine/threonine-protein kinase [Methanomicrobium sp.]|nr:serine/threonine-protein kinase [Methanomicrobium sp.]
MQGRKFLLYALIVAFAASAFAMPAYAGAEFSSAQSTQTQTGIKDSENTVVQITSENEFSESASAEDYHEYMRNFSSNVILLFILCVSGIFLLLLRYTGRKYSDNFYYTEKFYLRVILIPTYSVMGILLVLISLFSIAVIKNAGDLSSPDTVSTLIFATMVFSYAMSSLLLAYSIVIKRAVLYILGFEIAAPFILFLFSITDLSGYSSSTELFLGIFISVLFSFILVSVPLMHTRMLIRRKSYSGFESESEDKSSESESEDGKSTLPFDEEGKAIMMQAKKINCIPEDLLVRYMDAEYIGKGGTARIFKAKRRDDGEVVAVKVPISFDERTGRSFLKEMNLWKELDHKNIVRVYSVNILPVPYVEMEYCQQSLADINKPLSGEISAGIISEISKGLLYAHSRGVIHRDIKPQNILISEDKTPKLSDWGLGKIISDNNVTKTLAFSLNYASPEQVAPGIFGRCDERTDIFQMGIVFYELLTGCIPFSGEGVGEFSTSIIHNDPKIPSAINPDAKKFDKIIMRCLKKDPDERYRCIEEFLDDLNRLTGSLNYS